MLDNKPYVKEYDEEGNLLNPIDGAYLHYGLNRRQRRRLGDKMWREARELAKRARKE